MKIDRRTFIAGAAAAALPLPAIAKYANPETAEQLYDYLLRHCICSEGQAAACHVVEDGTEWSLDDGSPIRAIKFLRYQTRLSSGVQAEGEILNMDGLCTDEAAATRMWLANFRRDAGDATHIIWRMKPVYEFIPERWLPVRTASNCTTFERDSSFTPGGLIYSRLWFGKLRG